MTIKELITPELTEAWQQSEEWRERYQGIKASFGIEVREALAVGIRDLLAALLESEFRHIHGHFEIDNRCMNCAELGMAVDDPRHNYTWEQWQAEAVKILEAKS